MRGGPRKHGVSTSSIGLISGTAGAELQCVLNGGKTFEHFTITSVHDLKNPVRNETSCRWIASTMTAIMNLGTFGGQRINSSKIIGGNVRNRFHSRQAATKEDSYGTYQLHDDVRVEVFGVCLARTGLHVGVHA